MAVLQPFIPESIRDCRYAELWLSFFHLCSSKVHTVPTPLRYPIDCNCEMSAAISFHDGANRQWRQLGWVRAQPQFVRSRMPTSLGAVSLHLPSCWLRGCPKASSIGTDSLTLFPVHKPTANTAVPEHSPSLQTAQRRSAGLITCPMGPALRR